MVGITLASARGGEKIDVQTRGFYTSDDGPELYTFLDSLYECILAHGIPLRPEQIQTVFLSITDGVNATAVVNHPLTMKVLTKGAVQAGDPVHYDHLADIVEARIPGYELLDRGAIAYLFQHGWRRGFYFDFSSHRTDATMNAPLGNVSTLLGSLHAALLLRDRVRMDSTVLQRMASAGWFPFTRLSKKHLLELYWHFENEWDTAQPVAAILDALGPEIVHIVAGWGNKPAFAPHMDVLTTAARLFEQKEYLAAASTVMPKVEGVLRQLYLGADGRPNAPELRRHLVGRVRAAVDGYTALLPEAFVQYLAQYYYAGFDLKNGVVPPSRHAFLHGIGPDEQLHDPTYSLRLFLTLDQVFFCVSRMPDLDRAQTDAVSLTTHTEDG